MIYDGNDIQKQLSWTHILPYSLKTTEDLNPLKYSEKIVFTLSLAIVSWISHKTPQTETRMNYGISSN